MTFCLESCVSHHFQILSGTRQLILFRVWHNKDIRKYENNSVFGHINLWVRSVKDSNLPLENKSCKLLIPL